MGIKSWEMGTCLVYAEIEVSHYAISRGDSMSLSNQIRDLWCKFQGELFPEPQAEVGTPLKNHQRFVAVLEVVCPESFI